MSLSEEKDPFFISTQRVYQKLIRKMNLYSINNTENLYYEICSTKENKKVYFKSNVFVLKSIIFNLLSCITFFFLLAEYVGSNSRFIKLWIFIIFAIFIWIDFTSSFFFKDGRHGFTEGKIHYYGPYFVDVYGMKTKAEKKFWPWQKPLEMRKVYLYSSLIFLNFMSKDDLPMDEERFLFRLKKTEAQLTASKPYYATEKSLKFQLLINYVYLVTYVLELIFFIASIIIMRDNK